MGLDHRRVQRVWRRGRPCFRRGRLQTPARCPARRSPREVAAEARQAGAPEAHFHALDVSKTSSVDAFVAWARQTIAKPQSAGPPASTCSSTTPAARRAWTPWPKARMTTGKPCCRPTCWAFLRMTRAALPLMLDNPGSSLINIGSLAGRVAYEGGAAYCAAKAGELQITRALRLELNGTGIRVSTVDPGLAETEFSIVRFKGDAPGPKSPTKAPTPSSPKTSPTSWSGSPAGPRTSTLTNCSSSPWTRPPSIRSIGGQLSPDVSYTPDAPWGRAGPNKDHDS